MPIPPVHVPDELKQAFRRIALNGNPHWVSYYSSDKVPGHNDLQVSVGHVTSGGKDYRSRAHKPYWYTQAVVDERKLGFCRDRLAQIDRAAAAERDHAAARLRGRVVDTLGRHLGPPCRARDR